MLLSSNIINTWRRFAAVFALYAEVKPYRGGGCTMRMGSMCVGTGKCLEVYLCTTAIPSSNKQTERK